MNEYKKGVCLATLSTLVWLCVIMIAPNIVILKLASAVILVWSFKYKLLCIECSEEIERLKRK